MARCYNLPSAPWHLSGTCKDNTQEQILREFSVPSWTLSEETLWRGWGGICWDNSDYPVEAYSLYLTRALGYYMSHVLIVWFLFTSNLRPGLKAKIFLQTGPPLPSGFLPFSILPPHTSIPKIPILELKTADKEDMNHI